MSWRWSSIETASGLFTTPWPSQHGHVLDSMVAEPQARHNTKLTFVSELHRHPESYSILDAETGRVLYSSGAARPAV